MPLGRVPGKPLWCVIPHHVLKLNRAHQLQDYTDDINLFGDNRKHITSNSQQYEEWLEANTEKLSIC
jgi:hypothetical protein